jgi:hypothetical protein
MFICLLYLETTPNLTRPQSVTTNHAVQGTTTVSKSPQLYRIPRMPTEKEAVLVCDKKF